MTANPKTILQNSQIAITLSLNVITRTDSDICLATLPLVRLTSIIFTLWQLARFLTLVKLDLSQLVSNAVQAVTFTGKVLAIGVSSLAYGMGVSL